MVRLSVGIENLFEDESRQHISGKQFVCHLLYLLSRNGINALVELFEITFLSVVKIASAEVKGKLLTVVTGNGELAFQLSLGGVELGYAKWFLHHTVEFMAHQVEALVDIMMVAAEIDTPESAVAIASHRTLDGIDQSVAFSQ